MTYKIPENIEELEEIKALDNFEVLVKEYNANRLKTNGKTISDVALMFEHITEWETIERVELLIPYINSKQRKEPKGHRIWYLSQPHESNYYCGQFFDVMVSKTGKRKIRKKCKLSEEAIKFFALPKVKENEEINGD